MPYNIINPFQTWTTTQANQFCVKMNQHGVTWTPEEANNYLDTFCTANDLDVHNPNMVPLKALWYSQNTTLKVLNRHKVLPQYTRAVNYAADPPDPPDPP